MSSLQEKVEQIQFSNYAEHDPSLKVRVNARGCCNRNVGYGNHFVELVLGMLRMGSDVRLYPEFLEPPLPPEFLACLLEPWEFDAAVGIHLANPMHLKRTGEHCIGITTWETTKIPPQDFRRSLSAVDEILVPCKDNIAVFEALTDVPVRYVPEGVDHEFFSARERDWSAKPLKIGMFGALTYRKGIDIGIEAFVDLFANDPDVELHIATTFYDLPQFRYLPEAYDNIFVEFFGWQPRETVREWYYDKHALFSPFRGEGYYLPGAEMLATGGSFIAPVEMGTVSYHGRDKGWVLPANYAPVLHWGEYHGEDASKRFGEWLEYDQEDVKNVLTDYVNASPGEKRKRADCAVGQMPHLADWDYAAQETIDRVIDAYRETANA